MSWPKSFFEMTPEEQDERISQSKKGSRFVSQTRTFEPPKRFGQAPAFRSDEIIGGRYCPGDGKVYESKSQWHRAMERNDTHMVPVGTVPGKKWGELPYTEEEYVDSVKAAVQIIESGAIREYMGPDEDALSRKRIEQELGTDGTREYKELKREIGS